MASNRLSQDNSRLITLLAVVLVITLLYVAREVLIPLALSVLLTFLLAPLCEQLERWKLGRLASVLAVTTMAFVGLGAVAWIVAGEVIELAGRMPEYQHNIRQKIQEVELPGSGPINRATESIKELAQDLLVTPPIADPDAPDPENAVPVQIVQSPLQPLEAIGNAINPILDPLVNAGIVIVFVIFMLLQRDDLRDRILRLIGQGRLTVATQAIDDAARRVSRYLSMQFIINATYGLAAGTGLFFIGIPSAVLWGACATLLRFIPYVGPWLGALFPIGLALAAFDTWTPVWLTISLFVVIELLSNNVMEPWLYGSRTGISPVAILVSAVFWTWLWGPAGLVLSTPLTVCVVVLGRYMPRLEFLSVLLSDEPGLSPAARLYQRLLAMDQDDVFEQAELYLADHTTVQLYDDVLLPALQLAERDRHADRLDAEHEQVAYQIIGDLIDELGDRPAATPQVEPLPAVEDSTSAPTPLPHRNGSPRIFCVPAQDGADELSCVMLAHILRQEGIAVEIARANGLLSEVLEKIGQFRPTIVCICAIPPQGVTRLRLLCKKLASQSNELRLVVGFWTAADLEGVRQHIKTCEPDRIVSSMSAALGLLRG